MIKLFLFFISFCIALASCTVVEKTAKKNLNDGYYYLQKDGKKQITYIKIKEDTISIHPSKVINKERLIDTLEICQIFQKEIKFENKKSNTFSKSSFDIDFLTIPLKFRPTQANVPAQLNTNLNGAFFIGFRNDRFVLNYITNPLGKSVRNINHFGYSLGAFSGLGNTFMSPTNTNNILQQEYDGIVWSKGIAGILAVNNFTVGLSIGFDNLLDQNRTVWIYRNQPWIGLAFGLNLN